MGRMVWDDACGTVSEKWRLCSSLRYALQPSKHQSTNAYTKKNRKALSYPPPCHPELVKVDLYRRLVLHVHRPRGRQPSGADEGGLELDIGRDAGAL